MNRSDLVQLLSNRFSQLTQRDAEAAVSTILEAMTGAPVLTPAARVPHFKPSKALREAVDLLADEVAPAKSQAK
jgi:integration host factor subunit beta